MTALEMHRQLMGIRELEQQIWRLKIQRDELQSCLLPKAIRYDKDTVQASPEDTMADIAGRVVDIDTELVRLRREKSKLIITLSRLIASLDDADEQTVLMAYYIGRKSGYWIAENVVSLSPQRIYQIRWAGLEHMAEKSRHILHEACDIV